MARRTELSYALTADSPSPPEAPDSGGPEEARNEDDTRIQPDTARSCRRCRGVEPLGECLGSGYAGQAVSTLARPRSPRLS